MITITTFRFKMFYNKLFVTCVLAISYFVPGDCHKTSDFRPGHDFGNTQSQHIQINHNNIPTITKDLFSEYHRVQTLEIESSHVHTIEEGAFRRLTSLKKLSLKRNRLTEIKKGIFSDSDIEELDLSENQISVIGEKAFVYMRKLKSITLKNNKIEVYNNNWFIHASKLCSINFANNLIESLPSKAVGNTFSRDCSVDLIFSNNSIQQVDEKALDGGFIKFDKVYLDHNSITTLPKRLFFHPNNIKKLRLDHNNIVCIPGFWVHQHVEDYNIDYNPWDQECLEAFKEGKDSTYFRTTTLPRTTTRRISTTRRHHRFNRFD